MPGSPHRSRLHVPAWADAACVAASPPRSSAGRLRRLVVTEARRIVSPPRLSLRVRPTTRPARHAGTDCLIRLRRVSAADVGGWGAAFAVRFVL